MSKAYLNALMEEGTREELFTWVKALDADCDQLRADKRRLDEELAVMRNNYNALQATLAAEQQNYSELLGDYYALSFMSHD